METLKKIKETGHELNAGGKGNFVQVLILSFSFMLVFTAFQTTEIVEETVLQSLRNESTTCVNDSATIRTNEYQGKCPEGTVESVGFTASGYTSLSIIHTSFSIAACIGPSVVSILYPKWSMILTGIIYVTFIASFLIPMTWLLYLLSGLLGIAAAVLWTAQGTFLSWVSTPDTITRNSGVFWAINSASLFFGNSLVYWQLRGKTVIDSYLRATIFIPLTTVATCGVCLMVFLKNLKKAPEEAAIKNPEEHEKECKNSGTGVIEPKGSARSTALTAFTDALKLFITPNMLLLSLASIYSGFAYSFLNGVYATSVGNTQRFGSDSKKYVGLVGIFVGLGEMFGGVIFGLFGSRTVKKGRTPIVLLGALLNFISYICIYLNIPDEATIRITQDASYIETPSAVLAIACSFLMGFGDSCLQTQLISTFASVYKDKSSAAFAIFKFTQSGGSAVEYYSASYMGIFDQTIFLVTACSVSAICFSIVEWRTRQSILKANNNSTEMKGEERVQTLVQEHA